MKCRNTFTLLILMSVLVLAVMLLVAQKTVNVPRQVAKKVHPSVMKDSPEFAIILCRGKASKAQSADSFQRQIKQTAVLLKSAVALTSHTLIFNVVADSLDTYNEITNITKNWPIAYKKRIVFGEFKQVFYPKGTEKMRNMFRPCATERLFLAQVYNEKDSLVFLDTDTLFLRPPEELFFQIYGFGNNQTIGIAPCLYMYGPHFKKFPTYGSSGLNAGVLLMNLTRIRNFDGGWTDAIMNIVDTYKGKLLLADQDILNILFSSKERATQLYELSCEWNYRFRICTTGRNKCQHAEEFGIGLLHGTALTFVNGQEQKFKAVFEAWEQYQFDKPISVFAANLNEILTRQKESNGCTRMKNVNKMLLKGLLATVEETGRNEHNFSGSTPA